MFELSNEEICIRTFIASLLLIEGHDLSYAFAKYFEDYHQPDLLTRPSDYKMYNFQELSLKELQSLNVLDFSLREINTEIKDAISFKKLLP